MPTSSSHHCYRAYGLQIRSCLALPELVAVPKEGRDPSVEPDVHIRFGEVMPLPAEVEQTGRRSYATPEHITLAYQNLARFLIRSGSEIVVQPAPGVDECTLRLFLLGVCFGALLHQRGLLVLHASAIALDGRAIAFVGHKGHGKSTMAATLHARGHPLIADDMVAVELAPGGPQVYPGFPQIKLWPDAVAASLDVSPETLPQLHPQMGKRASPAARSFPCGLMPLSAIYVLGLADKVSIGTIAPQEAFIELVRYSYLARVLGDTNTSRQHFEQCVHLTRSVDVFYLNRPDDLSLLPHIAHLVEQRVGVDVP